MAIISKQIGWSQESNLLWYILKQLNQLTSALFGLKEAATPKYKVYTALLTQSGENAPTATILENTIGNITFGISSVGNYTVESNGLFISDKTYFSVSFVSDTSTGCTFGINDESSLYIEGYLRIGDGAITSIDNLYNTPIEIRVYN